MNNDPKLLFANIDDELVHIGDYVKGQKASCPYCGNDLIAKKGKVMTHHYAHKKDESCLDTSKTGGIVKLPFFEFMRLGLTNAQLENLAMLPSFFYEGSFNRIKYNYNGNWLGSDGKGRSSYIKNYYSYLFVGMGLMVSHGKEEYTMGGQYHKWKERYWKYSLTERAKIVLCQYSLKAYYKFCLKEKGDGLGDIEKDMLKSMIKRFEGLTLYFAQLSLALPTSNETVYKIGVTSRSVGERMDEVRQHVAKRLKIQKDDVTIDIVKAIKGVGVVEQYFIGKHRKQRLRVDGKDFGMEYFMFSDKDVKAIKKELHDLYLVSDEHKERTKKAMKGKDTRRGKGKVPFMEKPKSVAIARLINEGASLREVARRIGCSINTVRKVNEELKG